MAPASYAVWVLVLQTAAYVGYLNFGLQTAIGRYVAYANEKQDVEQRDSVFSTALAGLCFAAVASLAGLVAASLAAPAIFPSVPSPLIPQMRLALLLVGFSMAVELPASACNGVFIGMERYEIPALTVGGARLFSALGVIAAAFAGRSLVVMSAIVAAANLLSYLAQYLALRRIAPDVRFQPSLVLRSTARDLSGYCFGLTVMSFSMLLVAGFDLVLVGHFEFTVVTPYSVAASMTTLMSGLLFAIINVMMPHAATLHAGEKADAMGRLVITSTRISVLLLVLTGVPMFIYVAAGQQNYIKVSPLSEGVSNFIASIVLGSLFGGIGVALGTLFGSIVSVASHLWYSMPRTKPVINFSRRDFVASGVLCPLLWTCPLLATALASWRGIEIRPFIFATVLLVSAMGGAGLLLFRRQE
jgi:O-antigen/teichoic acid export membrane protein